MPTTTTDDDPPIPPALDRPLLYAISASVRTATRVDNDRTVWIGTIHLPLFYLDARTSGIVSPEHAERIATRIVNPTSIPDFVVAIRAHMV